MAIKLDDAIDGEKDDRCYVAPDGKVFEVKESNAGSDNCLLAGCGSLENGAYASQRNGMLLVLDGSRLLRRVGRLIEKGAINPESLPLMIGVDPADGLADYTPWWHPAFKRDAPDFGGQADAFRTRLLNIVSTAEERWIQNVDSVGSRCGLLGYSLAGLFCLDTLMHPTPFDMLLVASPSTWYAGFVNRLVRQPFANDPRVIIACGSDEGAGHPEPICGIAQDTRRAVEVLDEKLSHPVEFLLDDRGHHDGLTLRLQELLQRGYA